MKLPFTILCDVNEKAPWSFSGMFATIKGKRREVEVQTREVRLPVDTGDYQIEGLNTVTVERKSIEDLFSTLANKEDFEKQVENMNFFFDCSLVIVEAGWDEIRDPCRYNDNWRSRLNPESVNGMIWAWTVRYPRVHFFPAGTRRLAEIACFDFLYKAYTESLKNG